jgi:hypothetical protein
MCHPFFGLAETPHLEMRIMSLRENENPHKMPGEQQQRVNGDADRITTMTFTVTEM